MECKKDSKRGWDHGGPPAHQLQPACCSSRLWLAGPSLLPAMVGSFSSCCSPCRRCAHRPGLASLPSCSALPAGVFIPLMLAFPQAAIPVVQLSLVSSLDPRVGGGGARGLCRAVEVCWRPVQLPLGCSWYILACGRVAAWVCAVGLLRSS